VYSLPIKLAYSCYSALQKSYFRFPLFKLITSHPPQLLLMFFGGGGGDPFEQFGHGGHGGGGGGRRGGGGPAADTSKLYETLGVSPSCIRSCVLTPNCCMLSLKGRLQPLAKPQLPPLTTGIRSILPLCLNGDQGMFLCLSLALHRCSESMVN
jgi:hypothetical protein